jgi:transcriptional regulator with XRE-family HTH domain
MADGTDGVVQHVRAVREAVWGKNSMSRLARATALSKTFLSCAERGDAAFTLAQIWRIAQALEVSPYTLFSFPEYPRPEGHPHEH